MNNESAAPGVRLDEIEMRLAHQDRMISELNEVITGQWRKIDALERRLSEALDELRNLTPRREGPEPPPPHY